MPQNKAIFLDRDGTLNEDYGFVYTPEKLRWIPGAKDALEYFKKHGYLLIVISNQSGVARGYYSENDVKVLHNYMQTQLLESHHIQIDAFYYCPHHPDGKIIKYRKKCKCRKPDIGLFEKAVEDYNIEPSQSLAVGDQARDLIPAMTVGIPELFMLKRNKGYEKLENSHFEVVKSWEELIERYKKVT